MLTIPADIILEKNKLYTSDAFIELLEWQISETGATVRVANYNEDVYWGHNTWTKFRFEGSDEHDSGGDSAEVVQINVSAIDRTIQGQLETLTNGGIGDTVIYRRVHSAHLHLGAVITASFSILDIDAGPSDEWVIFNLGQENFFLSQFPANVFRRDVCRYRPSQTDVCSYVNNSVCNRDFANCIYLGQESVFGGQPGIPGGVFNLYDILISVGVASANVTIRSYYPDVRHQGTVNANLGQITVTGYNTEVTTTATAHANLGQITIDSYSVTVTKLTQIDISSTEAVTIDRYSAIVTNKTQIDATLGQVTVAGYNQSIVTGTTVECSLGQVSIVGLNLNINSKTSANISLGTITIDGLNATIEAETLIESSTGVVVIAGYDVSINSEIVVSSTLGQLTIDGYGVTVQTGLPVNVGLGTLTITGYDPGITAGGEIQDTSGDAILDTSGDAIEEPT